MLNLNSVMLGSKNPKIMSDFYEKVFGKKPDMVDGDWTGWQVGASFFGVGSHSEVGEKNNEPSRIMLNLETEEVQKEFDRIKALGAKVIKEPYAMGESAMWIATFEDPDGNYFQLMSPWKG